MVKINDRLINDLAYNFSRTKSQYIFNILYREVEGFIKMSGKKAYVRAKNYGVHIPLEDFESYYNEALWKSAIDYDEKLGEFMPRLLTNIRRLERNVWRQYETKGGDKDKSGKRYEKAQNDSLDRIIDQDSGFTLGEVLLKSTKSTEQLFFEKESIRKILEDFEKINERYAKVVTLIYFGATNDEIARAFGESEYNAKTRKLVQRAKESFRKFLISNEFF